MMLFTTLKYCITLFNIVCVAVGDECTVDIDCTFGNATCNKFVCAIKSEADKAVEFSSNIILTNEILHKS